MKARSLFIVFLCTLCLVFIVGWLPMLILFRIATPLSGTKQGILRWNESLSTASKLWSMWSNNNCESELQYCKRTVASIEDEVSHLESNMVNVLNVARSADSSVKVDDSIAVNVAPLGLATQSSAFHYNCDPYRALDGTTMAFYEPLCENAAITNGNSKSPWWQVDLLRLRPVVSVDVFIPLRHCDTYKYPMIECPGEHPMPLLQHELVIELRSSNGTVISKKAFSREQNDQGEVGGAHGFFSYSVSDDASAFVECDVVRVALQPKDDRAHNARLYLSEVRVNAVMRVGSNIECDEYCVNGACDPSGTCICEPDYVGMDCATNALFDYVHWPTRHEREMQSKHSRRSRELGNLKMFDMLSSAIPEAKRTLSWWSAREAAAAMERIVQLQNPSTCTTQHNLWCRAIYQPGLGSFLHMVTGYLTHAHNRGQAMVVDFDALLHQSKGSGHGHARWNYAENEWCRNAGMENSSCYFQPWSKCSAGSFTTAREPECCLCYTSDPEGKGFDFTDLAFETPRKYRQKGKLWYRSIQLSYLTRLRSEFAAEVNVAEAKKLLRWPTDAPVIGIHVRHTDSCSTTLRKGRCLPFSAYVRIAEMMKFRYSTTHVFVATDSVQIAEEAKRKGMMIVDLEVRKQLIGRSMIEGRIKNGQIDMFEASRTAILEVNLLAESDMLILQHSGNLARMAIELSIARKGFVVPFASMDSAWCPTWRMCCDVTAHGRRVC